jgi:hypothetical protein
VRLALDFVKEMKFQNGSVTISNDRVLSTSRTEQS